MTQMSATTGENKHFPALDGIRGIAILLVLLSHAVDFLGPVPRRLPGLIWPQIMTITFLPGWAGVDLFFALSGFLITGILLRARRSPTYFSSFYARRALRIFPVYYVFLTLSLLVASRWAAFADYLPHSSLERASFFVFLQNWPIFWKSWAAMSALWSPYWSLAVEEQFYLVWPTLIRLLKPRTMFYLCIVGFLLGSVERALMIRHLGLQFGLMQWPFSRLDGLFLGAAVALYREVWDRIVPMRWAVAAFSVGATLYLSIVLLHHTELEGSGSHLWIIGVSAFALMSAGLIAAAEHRPPWLVRILSVRPLLLAGRYSYGIYVYHLMFYIAFEWLWFTHIAPVIGYHLITSIAYIALTISVTFAFAALSFRYYEAPFLKLKRFFPSPSAPV